MSQTLAHYREYAPCDPLLSSVRALFSFTVPQPAAAHRRVIREVRFGAGDPFCSPLFADGNVSVVVNLARGYGADGRWRPRATPPGGSAIGAMHEVGSAEPGERRDMVGAYLHAARAPLFTQVPASELTDRVVALEDLWGPSSGELTARLLEANLEEERLRLLESALLRRMGDRRFPKNSIDVPGLAAYVMERRGRPTIEHLADAAGVSRQHLSRAFRQSVGVGPKTYSRLARFQAALAYAGRGANVDWAQASAEMGYADQSHMIAEFRQFSSLTPGALAARRWFHPFIERARDSIFPIARCRR